MVTRRSPIAIARWTVDAAIVALVAAVLFGLILGRVVPLTGRETLIIGGSSMEPAIPLGAAVVIEPVVPADLASGDVVTIKVGPRSSLFTHRVTRVLTLDGDLYLETKGDANDAPDASTIPASAVVGRMAWSFPYMGYLLALLSVPAGVAFVMLLGVSLVVTALVLETFGGGRIRPVGEPRSASPGGPVAVADGPWITGGTAPALEGRIARHLAARRASGATRPRPARRPG